jgi:hypothetical protein
MVSEEQDEQFTTQEKQMLLYVAGALLLVVVMVCVVISVAWHGASRTEFRNDCMKLGGKPRDLGDDVVCLYKDRPIGTFD